MNSREYRNEQPRSHLFMVRLWREEMNDDTYEVRMQVKHVLSGETHYFREWQALVSHLQRILQSGTQAE